MCHRFVPFTRAELETAIALVKAGAADDRAAHTAANAAHDTTVSAHEAHNPTNERAPAGERRPPSGGCTALAQVLALHVEPPVETAGDPQQPLEARPGSLVPVLCVRDGRLALVDMTWGYEAPWKPGSGSLIFNARLESALTKPGNMWAESLASRRCVVPARRFFESHRSLTTPSPRTGKPIKQQMVFELASDSDTNGTAPDNTDASRPSSESSTRSSTQSDTVATHPSALGNTRSNTVPLFLAGIYQDERFVVMTCEPNVDVAPVHDRMPVALRGSEVSSWLGRSYASLVNRAALRLHVEPERA